MNGRRNGEQQFLASVLIRLTLSAVLTTLAILPLCEQANADQRGAERSFDAKADPHRLTIAQHLADLDAVVNHLKESLGQDKIILMGHSWGAALGLLYTHACPEKVSAFIAVNPLVSLSESQQAQYDFVLEEATRRHDAKALKRLQEIGTPPYKRASQALAMEKVAQRYGAIFHTGPNRAWVMLRAIFSGLVTPWEIPRK
jgi:proline iminopeptidase